MPSGALVPRSRRDGPSAPAASDNVRVQVPKAVDLGRSGEPMSTCPGWTMGPHTAERQHSIADPSMRHASPIPHGVLAGRASTPLSKIRIARGACVAFASIPPSVWRPVPMNAISPSRNSRAAPSTTRIESRGAARSRRGPSQPRPQPSHPAACGSAPRSWRRRWAARRRRAPCPC